MIEIDVPKDVRKYEAKLIGPLTTRQTICFVLMAAVGILTFKAMGKEIGNDVKIFIEMILILPFLLVGWVKPYGMHFEKFVKTAFASNVLSKKKRQYKINNTYKINEENKKKYSSVSQKTKAEMAKLKKRKNIDGEIAYL